MVKKGTVETLKFNLVESVAFEYPVDDGSDYIYELSGDDLNDALSYIFHHNTLVDIQSVLGSELDDIPEDLTEDDIKKWLKDEFADEIVQAFSDDVKDMFRDEAMDQKSEEDMDPYMYNGVHEKDFH